MFRALLNIEAMFVLISLTVAPSCATTFASAAIASFHAPLAVAVAATAARTLLTNVTACGDVNVCPATVKMALAQYWGIPATSALYSESVSGLIGRAMTYLFL